MIIKNIRIIQDVNFLMVGQGRSWLTRRLATYDYSFLAFI